MRRPPFSCILWVSPSMEDLREKALRVHERLCDAYGCPVPYFHELDPLSELVSSLLSHRTKNADSARAYRELRARFPDWAAVRDAPTADIEAAIAACTWPEQKAPRLQKILRQIGDERGGDLSLDFLADLPVAGGAGLAGTAAGRRPQDQRRRAVLLAPAPPRPARGQPPPPGRPAPGPDPADGGCRPVPRPPGSPAAAGVGRPAGLRPPRGADAARPALLLLPKPRLLPLSRAGPMPVRPGAVTGFGRRVKGQESASWRRKQHSRRGTPTVRGRRRGRG